MRKESSIFRSQIRFVSSVAVLSLVCALSSGCSSVDKPTVQPITHPAPPVHAADVRVRVNDVIALDSPLPRNFGLDGNYEFKFDGQYNSCETQYQTFDLTPSVVSGLRPYVKNVFGSSESGAADYELATFTFGSDCYAYGHGDSTSLPIYLGSSQSRVRRIRIPVIGVLSDARTGEVISTVHLSAMLDMEQSSNRFYLFTFKSTPRASSPDAARKAMNELGAQLGNKIVAIYETRLGGTGSAK